MDIGSKMPSKKIVSLLIIVAAFAFSIVIVFGKEKSGEAINSLGNIVVGQKIKVPEKTDWQSELENIGVSGQNLVQASEEDDNTESNLTESVSINLFSNYLALKQAGTLDNVSAQDLVDKNIDRIDYPLISSVTASNLKIIPDNGNITITQYGEDLGNILKKYKNESSGNEFEIILEAMNARDPQKLKEIDGAIVVYELLENDLKKMNVPKTFVKAHIDILKGINGTISGLQDVTDLFNDPLKGLSGLKIFQENSLLFVDVVQTTSLFIKKNTTYKQGSGGYYLLNGI